MAWSICGARTFTFALNNVILPFTRVSADKGWVQARRDDVDLRDGLHVHAGRIAHAAVTQALGLPHMPAAEALSSRAVKLAAA